MHSLNNAKEFQVGIPFTKPVIAFNKKSVRCLSPENMTTEGIINMWFTAKQLMHSLHMPLQQEREVLGNWIAGEP